MKKKRWSELSATVGRVRKKPTTRKAAYRYWRWDRPEIYWDPKQGAHWEEDIDMDALIELKEISWYEYDF